MYAIQMIRLDPDKRAAETALVQAVGGQSYTDPTGNVWHVMESLDGKPIANPQAALQIVTIPAAWKPIGEAEGMDEYERDILRPYVYQPGVVDNTPTGVGDKIY